MNPIHVSGSAFSVRPCKLCGKPATQALVCNSCLIDTMNKETERDEYSEEKYKKAVEETQKKLEISRGS